jgi:hypothetical protein
MGYVCKSLAEDVQIARPAKFLLTKKGVSAAIAADTPDLLS